MRVTIQKTIDVEDIPDEIECNLIAIQERIIGLSHLIADARHEAEEGRYMNQAEILESMRNLLSLIDQTLEEQQSLSVSYEKIKISKLMPEGQASAE